MSKNIKPFQFINFDESDNVIKSQKDPLSNFNIKREFIPEFNVEKEEKFKNLFSEEGELTKEDYQKSIELYYKKKKQDAESEIFNYIKEKKKEAEKILEDAQKQYENIRQQAYNEGFDEGFKKGFEEGKEEVQKRIEELKELIMNLANFENKVVKENGNKLGKLIVKFAEKIIKKELEVFKNEILLENLKIALEKIVDKSYLKIKLNTSQFEFIFNKMNELKDLYNVKNLEIEKSTEITPGGCIIETNFGDYDLRIEEQIFELERAIINKNFS